MKYEQPYGVTDPNAPYINGNPATGTMGSIPPAASIENPQREIVNFIADAGALVPSAADLHQLGKTVQSGKVQFAPQDIGTVNAIIVALSPVPDAYTDGMQVRFRAKFTPTGPTTLDAGRGARPLMKSGGGTLVGAEWSVGDIVEATYDLANTRWQLPVSPFAMLYAPKDYYVNGTSGNDSNNGLTPATAFKTLQAAQNATYLFNLNGFAINIHVADGNYGPVSCGLINGSGSINWMGNTANPAACFVVNSAGSAFSFGGVGYTITGFKVSSTGRGGPGGTGNGIWAPGGSVTVYNVDFGNCVDYQCVADGGGYISYLGPITISGSAAVHAVSANGSYIRQGGVGTSAIVIAPVSFAAFIEATGGGVTYITYSPMQNPGNVSGVKYTANGNGVILTDGSGINYYPGTSPGVLATGGQYV